MSDSISREDAIKVVHEHFIEALYEEITKIDEDGDEVFADMRSVNKLLTHNKVISKALKALPSADAVQGWIPLSHDDDGLGTDFPYERDGQWVIVTDGKSISVERVKKDAYDHFYPNGRWFELDDVLAWMPLPTPYKGGGAE